MGKLTGKIAVITGATEGIGLAIAQEFVNEGAFVFFTGRHKEKLDRAASQLGAMAVGIQGDVARLSDIVCLYETVAEYQKYIDIVVANAGFNEVSLLEDVDEAIFDRLFTINAKGAFFTIQKAIPLLRDNASIIITGSVASSKGTPGMGIYGATKAAVRSFARTLAAELANRNIRVNVISPGPIDTPLIGRQPADTVRAMVSGIPLGRMGRVNEVAKAALFLASDDSSFTTGSEFFVDGGRAQV
ncbi:glucose 1-dehydrogenase [Pectobacterium parmentieri]|uniref:Glucose 1-dehydrogenase n=1 Tax=Pectobacterium parmentieri TaxID=1905730 RepID=A0A0H3I4Q2_PECPM|nr:glucose 1-dehydrogenase [Pectobacterium parmentieri]AFI89673.1 Short-chain dehydrogenase/reductase SDR [Pectobacterium parmentieri]MBI0472094.1 glucose 1-dehydrogenase [Pectobacterium parmentieri]MBI0495873.1 glucose 1-dehydrogenase [Pectobacterium parmentieri]MBI0556255.1 glucose 1-dehydrogenase [Pectobacterium parmentieri]MBI0569339.1 glucose 1-dehydrogenase [Pectobacterium parmentieri]